MLYKGTVIKSTGNWYQVATDQKIILCRIVGKFRLGDKVLTNPVAVGDKVDIEPEGSDKGLIKHIYPRANYITRQSPRQKHHLHLLAANVDQACVVVTLVQPNLKQGFIDRFVMMTEPQNIPCFIVVNKSDLFSQAEDILFQELKTLYESIGYPILAVSALSGSGLEELKNKLKNKITFIGGQSGVGKSTLINSIQPRLDLRTTEISDYSGKGTHTTTFAEMHSLDFGGWIIDTPGIKTLSFNNLETMDVAHNFREFFSILGGCKYGDCLHRDEPGCAVKKALEAGKIHPLRYANYLAILDEIDDQNYWERHKEM